MANIKISELNELLPGQKAYDDYLAIVDSSADETKKISVETLTSTGVKLIAVSSTAPTEFSNGDKYYNSTTNRIYEARTDVWYNPQEPVEGIFYIIFDSQNIYTYDKENETLVSVGGGAGGGDATPIGTVEAYAGSTAPDGYLLCDGSAVSRTTYSDLFNVIGTTYGSGDGSTTFSLPNIKGRIVVMLDSTQTEFDTLGETGGSKELQEHTHNFGIASQYGTFTSGSGGYLGGSAGENTSLVKSAGTGNSGNLQPYIVLNYIIKAFNTSSAPTESQVVNIYSNSTSDVYSCNYINNNDTYSTNEIKTNMRWIDGKPIYRKVFTGTTPASISSWTNIDTISNVSEITKISGICARGNIPRYTGDDYWIDADFYASTNYLRIRGAGYTNLAYSIIVEYTKTTD